MAAFGSEPVPWLRPLSWVYGLGARLRNLGFRLGLCRVRELPVPVVSVGNLTVGGTGKTPFVAWLVERYRAAGLRVGVLARGYARRGGEELNDEGRLLARRFVDLPQVQNADRYEGGQQLLAGHEIDVIVLDDGFQHRRLARDLDICLLDAARPLAGGLLPAGALREPARALARADLCVVSGTQGVDEAVVAATVALAGRLSGGKPCLRVATVAEDVLELPQGNAQPVSVLAGRACVLLAAIARPERFRATVEQLGASVRETVFLRDHAEIPRGRLSMLSALAEKQGVLLVLTEKDEARMDIPPGEGPPRCVLRVGLRFADEPDLGLLLPERLRAG